MAVTTSYDPATLEFVVDQSTYPTGKKHYNPHPRSRIPATPRSPRKASASPRPSPPSPVQAFTTDPWYLLSVPSGHEVQIADRLTQFAPVTHVFIPRMADGQPAIAGRFFVAISNAALAAVRAQIRTEYWGWLDTDAVAPDVLEPFLPYAEAHAGLTTHPLTHLAESVLHHRGYHGQLTPTGWALTNVHGHAVQDAAFDTLWHAWTDAWSVHQPLPAIVAQHAPELIGVTYPVDLVQTPRYKDWTCRWMGMEGMIPAHEHHNIRPRQSLVAAYLVAIHGTTAVWSLRHPAVVADRLRYRTPYLDIARVPGQWAVILVPYLNDTIHMHLRQTQHGLGWSEAWRGVAQTEVAGIIRNMLKPRDVTFDRSARVITLSQVPVDRQRWITTVRDWLPDWTITES